MVLGVGELLRSEVGFKGGRLGWPGFGGKTWKGISEFALLRASEESGRRKGRGLCCPELNRNRRMDDRKRGERVAGPAEVESDSKKAGLGNAGGGSEKQERGSAFFWFDRLEGIGHAMREGLLCT